MRSVAKTDIVNTDSGAACLDISDSGSAVEAEHITAQGNQSTKKVPDGISQSNDSAPSPVIHTNNDTLITAIADLLKPVNDSLQKLNEGQKESERLFNENTHLKERIEELERQLRSAEQRAAAEHSAAVSLSADNSSLEAKIAELDAKLREAYSINARESSLEAERIKAELSKSLSFCYDNWKEYESADYSDDNYESIMAIIRRVFRVLEKNQIILKGNKE